MPAAASSPDFSEVPPPLGSGGAGVSPSPPPALQERDRALLDAAAHGDHRAFADLYDRLAAPVFSLILRMVGNERAAAEDIFQESLLRLWRRAPAYDHRQSSVFTWAVTIARGKVIDYLRARGRRQQTFVETTPEDLAPRADPAPGADAIVQGREEAAAARRALGILPPEQRQVIELAFFGGLSHHEIAARLGQPLGTVKARIRRGLLQLRDELAPSLPPPSFAAPGKGRVPLSP